jgi:serine/threonine-protein kinase
VVINGQSYSRVFGGSVPAPIWAEFMALATEGLPESQFPGDPSNIEEYLVPPPTTVPVVVGQSEGSAAKELRDAKLNVAVQEIASLEPAGTVVRQSIEPGATVPQGTTVTIWVSNGETPVGALPSFVGMTAEEATAAAEEFSLTTNVLLSLVTEDAPTQDGNLIGRVLATNPPPGTQISEAASVVLFIGVAAPPPGGGDD